MSHSERKGEITSPALDSANQGGVDPASDSVSGVFQWGYSCEPLFIGFSSWASGNLFPPQLQDWLVTGPSYQVSGAFSRPSSRPRSDWDIECSGTVVPRSVVARFTGWLLRASLLHWLLLFCCISFQQWPMALKRLYVKVKFHTQQTSFNLYFFCIWEQALLLMGLAMFTRGKSTFAWEGKVSSCITTVHMDLYGTQSIQLQCDQRRYGWFTLSMTRERTQGNVGLCHIFSMISHCLFLSQTDLIHPFSNWCKLGKILFNGCTLT